MNPLEARDIWSPQPENVLNLKVVTFHRITGSGAERVKNEVTYKKMCIKGIITFQICQRFCPGSRKARRYILNPGRKRKWIMIMIFLEI